MTNEKLTKILEWVGKCRPNNVDNYTEEEMAAIVQYFKSIDKLYVDVAMKYLGYGLRHEDYINFMSPENINCVIDIKDSCLLQMYNCEKLKPLEKLYDKRFGDDTEMNSKKSQGVDLDFSKVYLKIKEMGG